ncbi:hypothetical protein JCM15519_38410 [Fundidesulfovibrio butyratiphilus]
MITAKLQRPPSRQDVWDVMRERREFVAQDLVRLTGATLAMVADYIASLRKAGFVAIAGETESPGGNPGSFKRALYRLVRDNGREAPRVRKDGTSCPPTKRESMWRTMPGLGAFTARNLALAASTEDVPVLETDAQDYVSHLYRAGYLALVKPASPKGGKAVYRLVKRTGGLPPQVLRTKAVYDPNRKEIVWMDLGGVTS